MLPQVVLYLGGGERGGCDCWFGERKRQLEGPNLLHNHGETQGLLDRHDFSLCGPIPLCSHHHLSLSVLHPNQKRKRAIFAEEKRAKRLQQDPEHSFYRAF